MCDHDPIDRRPPAPSIWRFEAIRGDTYLTALPRYYKHHAERADLSWKPFFIAAWLAWGTLLIAAVAFLCAFIGKALMLALGAH